MDIIHILLVDVIYITFPILFYIVLVAYNRAIDEEDNNLILEFSLFSSAYLITTYGIGISINKPIYLFNVPLLIAYLKKKDMVSIGISLMLIMYIKYSLNFNIYYVVLDYILCYILYKIIKNPIKYSISFLIVKCLFVSPYIDSIFNNIVMIICFIFVTCLVVLLINYVSKIMNLCMSLKDIEKDKQVKKSLFKISHEVKNPIAVIKGYLSLMDGSIDKYNKYIPLVKDEVNHSLAILEVFSNIGKLKVEFDILDINYLLEDIVDMYKPILDSNRIKLIYKEEIDEVYINGDYKRLKEVLINIIKNSIEALYGRVNPYIKIYTKISSNKVDIIIEDNGCGISKDDMVNMSEPFFTTKKNGTGLGVYLSKEIINIHKGSLIYDSKEDVGTNVKVELNLINI